MGNSIVGKMGTGGNGVEWLRKGNEERKAEGKAKDLTQRARRSEHRGHGESEEGPLHDVK
jgi:hypothetical protein